MTTKLTTKRNARFSLGTALAAIFALGTISAHGQESDTTTQNLTLQVEEMAVIDVTGNPDPLVIQAPATAGEEPAPATDNTTRAHYTSMVDIGERSISAQLDLAPPAGTSLTLEAIPQAGEGTTAGVVTLGTEAAEDVVTGIGNVATGTGGEDGAQLNYELGFDDFSALEVGDENVVVTLTLTEAS